MLHILSTSTISATFSFGKISERNIARYPNPEHKSTTTTRSLGVRTSISRTYSIVFASTGADSFSSFANLPDFVTRNHTLFGMRFFHSPMHRTAASTSSG